VLSWNDLIGRRLDNYEIAEELGRGGSSRVYLAHALGKGYDAAIKVIPNDAEDRIGFVQRFAREVEVIRKLNHPNIVRVYGAGETDEIVYLILQCVMGGTLRQRLGGRPLPSPQAAAYVIQMARALHHAHQQGVVHRDVKPSNMLVDADDINHLLLTDFGTAKIQGARGLTKSGTTIGTPEYMSPEQAEGREIDQRADIYALGCVLYEALATRPPFIGSTPVSVLYQQVHSRPASIRSYNTTVSRELARVVEIALAKRPSDRYGTAEQLAEALTPFAAEVIQPTSAPWMAGGNLGMTPSAPFSGPLAQPRVARAPRTAPIPGVPSIYPNPLPPTPPTLPASGPLSPFTAPANGMNGAGATDTNWPATPASAGSSGLPAWLATAQASGAPPATPPWAADDAGVGQDADDEATAGPTPTTSARRIGRSAIPSQPFRIPSKPSQPVSQDGSQLERAQLAARFAQLEATQQRQRAQSLANDQPEQFASTPVLSLPTDEALAPFEARETEPQTPILAPDASVIPGDVLGATDARAPTSGRRKTLASAPGLADMLAPRAQAPSPSAPSIPSAPISAKIPTYPYATPSAGDSGGVADMLAPPTLETPAAVRTPSGLAPDMYVAPGGRRSGWPDEPIEEDVPPEQIETAPTLTVVSGRHAVAGAGRNGGNGRGGADGWDGRAERRGGGRARRPWLIGGVVATLLALAVVGYLALSASGLGALTGHGSPHAQASATTRPQPSATPTLNPTPTVTATPAGTATPSPQQILDQQAAASFRAVTLASFADGSCSSGNGQNHFSSGERVYINLCTSYNPASGPMTIQIRQNGAVVATLVYGQFLSANGSYWYYHSLNSGNYDALVTITLNGDQAVARDLYFSVG